MIGKNDVNYRVSGPGRQFGDSLEDGGNGSGGDTKPPKKKKKIRKPKTQEKKRDLPEFWWIDLIGIVLTIAGVIAVYANLEKVELVILTVVYNLVALAGILLVIAVIVLVIYFSFGRRRRRRY